MKRFNLLMMAIVLATLPAATLQAQEGGPDYKHKLIDGLWYTLDSVNYCATVGCRLGSYGYEYSGDIVIPEKVVYNDASYTVVGIEEQAFRGSSITSLIMPNTITTIGKSCFCYCYNLNPVILSENISELPSESFYECAIKSIDFPEGLKTIREKAFKRCYSLRSVDLHGITAIEKEAFSECTALTSAVLPSVDTIPARLFSDCNKLHSVVFPEGVKTISVQAFWNCAALQSVKFPESLVSIGTSAFVGCGLTSLFIPSKVNHIEMLAFDYNPFSSIAVAADNAVFDSRNDCNAIIDTETNTLLLGCKATVIPDDVTSIGQCSFADCKGLTSIVIPATVRNVGGSTFSGCRDLQSVTFLTTTTDLGTRLFWNCTSLKTMKVGWNRPPSIGDDMFRNAPLKDCTLYVPKGTGIMYMSAPVWINFGNIIEVDEPEEACYVTIRQGEGGAVKQSVKLGESYSYVFTPDAGWKIHTVTFNGEDVTSLLYNGQYSTPVITGDSELSVVYVEDTQGISQAVGESPVRVIAHGQSLSVSGVKDGSTVYVYDTQGKLLRTARGNATLTLPTGIYLVKAEGQTFKVAL
jgi:hypothetical protein